MESDIINRALQSTRGISESMRALDSALMEEGIRKRKVTDAQVVLPHLLSGDATFQAIEHAVDDLVKCVPQDHDVLILVDDLTVHDARFIGPHTFLFEGVNPEGRRAAVVCHFSTFFVKIHVFACMF